MGNSTSGSARDQYLDELLGWRNFTSVECDGVCKELDEEIDKIVALEKDKEESFTRNTTLVSRLKSELVKKQVSDWKGYLDSLAHFLSQQSGANLTRMETRVREIQKQDPQSLIALYEMEEAMQTLFLEMHMLVPHVALSPGRALLKNSHPVVLHKEDSALIDWYWQQGGQGVPTAFQNLPVRRHEELMLVLHPETETLYLFFQFKNPQPDMAPQTLVILRELMANYRLECGTFVNIAFVGTGENGELATQVMYHYIRDKNNCLQVRKLELVTFDAHPTLFEQQVTELENLQRHNNHHMRNYISGVQRKRMGDRVVPGVQLFLQ